MRVLTMAVTSVEDLKYAPGVDVVVVNYQTPWDLTRCLKSLAEVQYEVPMRVAVVNVDPTADDTEAYYESEDLFEVPSIGVYFDDNVGYSGACNSVAFSLLSDYGPARQTIAFFNADVEFRPGVLDHCHWQLHAQKDLAVIGPRQTNSEGRITHAGIVGTNKKPQLRGWMKPDNGQFNDYLDDCVSVSGSAYFVKRKVWDELTMCRSFRAAAPKATGGFLPTRHYYEETWFSYHARHHGYRVAYDGSYGMVHEWHRASPKGKADAAVAIESRRMFRDACDLHGIERD